jgi:hypothetical protein
VSDALASWAAALDQLEERNRRREAFLDGRGPVPDEDHEWSVPEVAMPEALAVRARLVVEHSRALEERVRVLLARRRPDAVGSPYA